MEQIPLFKMSMDLRDYVKVYDNFIDKEVCDEIVEKLKKEQWDRHSYYSMKKDEKTSFEDDLYVSNGLDEIRSQIMDNLWYAIKTYVFEDMLACSSWYNSWHGYTELRWNKYEVGTNMKLHCDHIHSMFDGNRKGIPTLSILGALNDDYEGGELIFWESEKIELKAGQIMIFPSNFMYPHKVQTITKGARFSYVSWVW